MSKEKVFQQPPAHHLAACIAGDIKSAQLKVGTVFASIPDLQQQYGAGRPVLKQAVRILEQRGIASLRRGVGGGLVALGPNPAYAGRALSILLEWDTPDIAQLRALATAVDRTFILAQPAPLTWESCQMLRDLAKKFDRMPENEFLRVKAHHQLANAIRTIAKNPMIDLAEKASYECSIDLIPYPVVIRTDAKSSPAWPLTLAMVEALVAGDTIELWRLREELLGIVEDAWNSWMAGQNAEGDRLPVIGDTQRPEFQNVSHQADRLAREILREISQLGWLEGERIASGVELMKRYQTTADVVRQAILMLQEYGVVNVEKGRSGGLYIAPIDREGILSAARDYLQRSGCEQPQLTSFLLQLSFAVIEELQQTGKGFLANKQAIDPFEKNADSLPDALASLCDHPVLNIFTKVIGPLLKPGDDSAVVQSLRLAAETQDISQLKRLLIEYYQSS